MNLVDYIGYCSKHETWDEEVMNRLIKRDIKIVDRSGFTALHRACYYNIPINYFQMMLDAYSEASIIKNNIGDIPLFWVVRDSKEDMIKALLKAWPSAITIQGYKGKTALDFAFEDAMPNIINLLIHNASSDFFSLFMQKKERIMKLVSRRFHDFARAFVDTIPSSLSPQQILNQHIKYYNNQKIQARDLHDLLLNLLSVSTRSFDDEGKLLALNSALKDNLIPWVFCEFLLYIYPEQAMDTLSNNKNNDPAIVYIANDSQKLHYGTCDNCGYCSSKRFYKTNHFRNCEKCYTGSRKAFYAAPSEYACEREKVQFIYLLLRENPFMCCNAK